MAATQTRQLGMVGLGRMGANIVRRLMRDGHPCVVYDRSPDSVQKLAGEGATGTSSLDDFVAGLAKPRAAWVMVPAGEITQQIIDQLADRMEPGDIIIDGGNSYYRDDIRRAAKLRERGIHLVDCGTSGGVWGLDRGYCLMIGGDDERGGRSDPAVPVAGAGRGHRAAHPGTHRRAQPGRAGLAALRAERRGPLRQDGSQRHRVRDDGVPGRGPQRAAQRGHRHPQAGGRRGDRAAGESRVSTSTTSTPPTWPRCGAGAA